MNKTTARVAATSALTLTALGGAAGVALASESGPAQHAGSDNHVRFVEHNRDHEQIGLLTGVGLGVGGLLHGVGQTLDPLLGGLL